MHASLLKLAADLAHRGEPFVLITVVRREAPSSARVGDGALVTKGGAFHGWLGGSCTQPTAVEQARAALADGAPRLVALKTDPATESRPGVTVLPMTCHSGGSVDLYVEPILPAPRLLVFGVSPTAQAVARIASVLGYTVEAIDAAADQAMFPEAERVVTDLNARELRERARRDPDRLFVVVAGLGDGDADALTTALDLGAAYLGVVASKRRFEQLCDVLRARGVSEGDIRRIDSPAGLDLGAVTPQEIAVSVLAEIVQRDRARGKQSPLGEGAEPAAHRDPVCGMAVKTDGAGPHAEFGGRTYRFCCDGCRTAFVAEPERFAVASGAGGMA